MQALHRRGRQSEIALVGFDDLALAELLTPGITVIAQDPAGIGRVAAERLFARMDDDSAPAETITVPARLISRGSGELRLQRADRTVEVTGLGCLTCRITR